MAETQRSAFRANLNQLIKAHKDEDDKLGIEAVIGIASLVFYELDRIADALEELVKKK